MGRIDDLVKDQIPHGDVEEAEAHDDQSHHGTGAKGDLQAAVEALAGALSGSRRGICGRLHPQKSAKAAEEAARQEGHRHKRVLDAFVGKEGKNRQQYDKHHSNYAVLP